MRNLTESLLETLKLRFDGWAMPTGQRDPLHSPGHRREMYEADTMWRNADVPPPPERKWVHIAD